MSTQTAQDGAASSEFEISIGNAAFEFAPALIADPKVTGTQIVALAGHHPVEEFVVLLHLRSGELESIRPTELVDLTARGAERVFVVRGADLHRFFVEGLSMEWPQETLTGANIRFLAHVSDDDELLLEKENAADAVIDDDQEVRIADPGVERFKTRPAKGHITIEVDAEPYQPPTRRMTPNAIIEKAGHKDPATNYLVQIVPHRVTYKDKGTIPIRLRNHEEFQIVSVGPAPVSDQAPKTGVTAFSAGLRELGFDPKDVLGHANHITFDYAVQSGLYAGRTVRIGLVIPADFPVTPPAGPQISPEIHPLHPSGTHPKGGIHAAPPAFLALGGGWQYWSRPARDWAKSKQSVAAYMNHIWQLWDTQ